MMEIASRDGPLMVTSILFTALACVIVICRLITRIALIKNPGADDYLIAAAMLASWGFFTVVMFQIKYGLGQPFLTIPPAHLPKFFQSLWATIPVYNLSLTLTKLSIVCQYLRIFSTPTIQKLCKIMIAILVVYGAWTVLGSTFMCIPVSYFWGEGTGHCMNRLAFWFSNAALNIATDILIFAIPVPLVRSLQLPQRQKIALAFVFAFGAFVCVTSVIRLRSLYMISISTDTSLDGVDCAIWSGIEINVAIGCSSLPTLRPLISRVLPGILSTNRSKNGVSSNGPKSAISHRMQSMRGKGDVQIETTFEVKGEYLDGESKKNASRDGVSERGLIDWNTDANSALGKTDMKSRDMV